MRLPSSYTNLTGRHTLRADQSVMEEVTKADGPAVDLEKDRSLVTNLDFETWLPFAAKTYHISPRIEDYVVIPTPICPADLPNRNGIGFPLQELVRYQPPPISRQVYKAWAGTPVHLEHCFAGSTKVRTRRGLKDISAIQVGDKVLTHKNRYRRVTKVFENGTKALYQIDAYGTTKPILATGNHPMWVVGRGQIFGDGGVSGARYKKETLAGIKPHFRPVTDVYPLDYLVLPLYIGGDQRVDPALAFLTGLYAAEGNLAPTNRHTGAFNAVVFTFAYNEKALMDKAVSCAQALGLPYTKSYYKDKGTAAFCIKDPEFAQLMYDLVGVYSHTKRVKPLMHGWDAEALSWFVGGYASGDGSIKSGRLRCITVSQDLAHDIQAILGHLGVPATANGRGWASMFTEKYTRRGEQRKNKGGKPWRNTTDTFCVSSAGNEIQHLIPYMVNRSLSEKQRVKEVGPKIIVGKNYLLLPISSIRKVHSEPVFNLEVEEDHTYVAGGVIVHNCNEDCTKAYGVVLDAALTRIQGYGGGKYWKVMGLAAVDKNKHPDIAQELVDGSIQTFSMGALADYFTCSVCGAPAYGEDERYKNCPHITHTQDVNFRIVNNHGMRKLAFLWAHGLSPIEFSIVRDPAWVVAHYDQVLLQGK